MYEETLTASDTLILITKDYVLKTRDSNKSKEFSGRVSFPEVFNSTEIYPDILVKCITF